MTLQRQERRKKKPDKRPYDPEAQRQLTLSEREADRLYGDLLKAEQRRGIPIKMLQKWLSLIEKRILINERSLARLSQATQVNTTTLRSILDGEWEASNLDIAERIATASGQMQEYYEQLPDTGREGWGPNGARHCSRCGTWWRAHYARSLCRRCYAVYAKAKESGRKVRPPMAERWSHKHDKCRCCGSSERKHGSRGLCERCRAACRDRARSLDMSYVEYLNSMHFVEYVRWLRKQDLRSERWAVEWDACRMCLRNATKHAGLGLCGRCRQACIYATRGTGMTVRYFVENDLYQDLARHVRDLDRRKTERYA